MILFHGTIESNLKSIKKNGILDATQDQWITEVTRIKVCCVGSQPTAGEGGNPSYFAYGNPKAKVENGYLVVIKVPLEFLQEKVIAVFNNRNLDDYVRYHFFPREEFAKVGFPLWQKLRSYKETEDRYLRSLEQHFDTRPATDTDRIIKSPKDQRLYYTKVFDKNQRNMYSLLGVEFSDELYSVIQKIGKWEPFYEFLHHHFEKMTPENYSSFHEKHRYRPLPEYWEAFYQHFPIEPAEDKYIYLQDWFAPKWLSSRKITEITKNSQILCRSIPPEYIKGFLHITTPSGFARRFKSFRSSSRFLGEVWKEALKIVEN